MKKIFILSCLSLFMFANEDYVPLSSFSDNQKADYNFINNSIIDATDLKTDATDDGYESVKEVVEPIKTNKTVIEEDNKDIIKKEEIVKEYKKDNILQDTKKETKISKQEQIKDFTVSPKIDFMYAQTDIGGTNGDMYSDKRVAVIPEISVSYKQHILKIESFNTKSNFIDANNFNSDLETKVKWHKLNYLYQYQNANVGLAYNNYTADFNIVNTNTKLQDKEEFPSLEVNFKNEDNKLLALYGGSLGKNNNIDYSYEYYLNLGYKILKNDDLVLSAGYKNKTIEYSDLRYKYQGPMISLGGTF